MLVMNSIASTIGTAAVNGPLVSKSSAMLDTVFLNSSAECNRPVRNFSCKKYEYRWYECSMEW